MVGIEVPENLWRFRLGPVENGEKYPEQLDQIWRFDARWMEPEYDDRNWETIKVPGCWQEAGFNYNGAAWYRYVFDYANLDSPKQKNVVKKGLRKWIRFEGVDYFCDVWVNGYYLGSHEGYFSSFHFEITPYLRKGDNVLAVKVISPQDICSKESQVHQLKQYIKGALQRWDVNDPLVNPGGIWNDVSFFTTGHAAIEDVRIMASVTAGGAIYEKNISIVKPLGASAPARILVSAYINTPSGSMADGRYTLDVVISPENFHGASFKERKEVVILPGRTPVHVSTDLPEAGLWFPWDIGEPRLYRVTVTLTTENGVEDSFETVTGIREIRQKEGWETYVNGYRLFQRGANYLSDQLLSSMDRQRYRKDVELAHQANLNTLHPFCVVEKQIFYDQCDRQGVLVYQDFPMWLEMSNTSDLVRRAVTQMKELIYQYGHHPSIITWNCGSQPSKANFMKLSHALVRAAREEDPGRIAHQGNALLDYETIQERVPRHPIGDFHWTEETAKEFRKRYGWKIDTHQYFGWYYKKKLSELKKVPRYYLELITEYGAQALPSKEMLERFIPPEDLFPPYWPSYSVRCFQKEEQVFHIGEPEYLERFIKDSQEYQALFIQYHTEYYRLHKYAPCNGAHLFCFNDCWPAITWAVVDYDRKPKPGYFSLQRSMAPCQTLLKLPDTFQPEETVAGKPIPIPVWIVNDLKKNYHDIVCEVRILCEMIEKSNKELFCKEFRQTIPEDSIVEIGEVCIPPFAEKEVSPEDCTGIVLQTSLMTNGVKKPIAENRYRFERDEDGVWKQRFAAS